MPNDLPVYRALVVDNDFWQRTHIREIAEDHFRTWAIETAVSVEHAIEQIDRKKYFLIICNQCMDADKMSGFGFLRALRKREDGHTYYFIVYGDNKECAKIAEEAGADGYFSMNTGPEVIVQEIRRVISQIE